MMRHLTDNDILVQEDLKLLIQAILNKQRRFENSKHNKALTFKSRFGKNIRKGLNSPNHLEASDKIVCKPIHCSDESNAFNYTKNRKSSETRKITSTPATNQMQKILSSFHDKDLKNISEFDMNSTDETSNHNKAQVTFEDTARTIEDNKEFKDFRIVTKTNHCRNYSTIAPKTDNGINKNNFTSFVNDFTQASLFEPIFTGTSSKKCSKRIDEVCPNFTKKGMHITSEFSFFERYMENKYLEKDADFINFQDFMNIDFTTYIFKPECEGGIVNPRCIEKKDTNTVEKVRVLYPSLIYDVYYYLCLYEFPDIKVVNEKYYDFIRKQINGEPIITDKEIIEKRRKSLWKYNKKEFQKLVKELESSKAAVRRIDLDSYLKSK